MVGRIESGKDTIQVLTESAATHVGKIAMIITGAVRDIAREAGEWMSDVIEMREATDRARADDERTRAATAPPAADTGEPDHDAT
jgi:hypothetical protein